MIKKILILLLLSVSIGINAERPQIIDPEIFWDNHMITFDSIKRIEHHHFTPLRSESKLRQGDVWLRFKLLNNDSQTSYYIYHPFIFYKYLDLYYDVNKVVAHKFASINQPFNKKPIYSHGLVLELPKSTDTLLCYLHLHCFWGNYLKLNIIDTQEMVMIEAHNNVPDYFFMGITALGMMLSLLLFFYLHEKTYVYYFLYSIAILISRLIHNGGIFNFTSYFIQINELTDILDLYSISYAFITIVTLLYFKSFLGINSSHKRLNYFFNILILTRIILVGIYVLILDITEIEVFSVSININHKAVDLLCIMSIIPIIFIQFKSFTTLKILALFSLLFLLSGNIINLIGDNFYMFDSYTTYLNLGSAEVVFFMFAIGYKHHYIKKQYEKSLLTIIEKMKETEAIKDNVNKELEIKVEERTIQISKMNELLQKHNIALTHEVEDISKAQIFQKNMSFEGFKKIFKDDDMCYAYLSEKKWGGANKYKCKRCAYPNFTLLENHSRRCKRCNYIESAMNNTLFANTRFPLLKAFYITYLTSSGGQDGTIDDIAQELELRKATYWKFKKKIQLLIEKTSNLKKHKDGWTHLVEYSIKHFEELPWLE